MKKIWIFLFIVLSIGFLVRYAFVGQAVYGDGIYYWAYTRSLYFDKNFDFKNEMSHAYDPKNNNSIREQYFEHYVHDEPTKNNAAANRYPPGAPLSWLPFFFLADIISRVFVSLGVHVPTLGYSDIYQILVGIGNVVYITLGAYVTYRFLQTFFVKNVAVITVLCMIFTTNLLYYGSFDVINSHSFSFFLSALFFYLWRITQKNRKLFHWLLLGLLLGLLTTTRTQDIVLGLVFFFDAFQYLRQKLLFQLVKNASLLLIGFLIGIAPQVITWVVLYDTFWKSPYVAGGGFNFLNPQIIGFLFNPKTGLMYFSFVYVLSLVGLMLHREKYAKETTFFLFLILAQCYVIASWGGWNQGESYGIRMLISLIPIMAVGIAQCINSMMTNLNRFVTICILLLFVLYNVLMIGIFQFYIQENTYIYGVRTEELILDRFNALF